MTRPLTTVFVRQGKYAEAVPHGAWSGASLTVAEIGDLQGITAEQFIDA